MEEAPVTAATGSLGPVIAKLAALLGSEYKLRRHTRRDVKFQIYVLERYLVIIDDTWNWREWEVIMKSLPANNLGSSIVGTTRIKAVADKWFKDSIGHDAFYPVWLPKWYSYGEWVYTIGHLNIVSLMIAMKADLVAEGFDNEHPIMHMCGGMPLAVRCMLSAVAQEREEQALQGIHAKARVLQDAIEKHVKENGIQNTPGFEPLVESLQLGYDDLPHHMLKTCLLYCSNFAGYKKDDVVWRWISEGFVYTEQQANCYFEELVNRGMIRPDEYSWFRMHPMMQNFLRWKSRQDNFTTCSSEITPSSCRIRWLCMDESRDAAADPLSALDWYHIRSLVVHQGIERVPFEKLEGVRLLDLPPTRLQDNLQDHHLKDICGLVRLRHLLGFQPLKTFHPFESGLAPGAMSLIGKLQQLKTLELRGPAITELPREIRALQQLQTLRMIETAIGELPREIGALQQLKTLRMTDTTIGELPREIGALQQLETLDMQISEKIMELPKEIRELQQLRTLNISCTQITVLPKEIWELQQLRTLNISSTNIRVLPKDIRQLQQLKTLDISSTKITVLPREMGKLQHLEHLLMSNTKVAKIPREIGALKELKSLSLDSTMVALPLEVCGALVELPECIQKAVNKIGLVSDLAGEMLSFQRSFFSGGLGGLVVGAKQMHIPWWITEHFNDLAMLDIRICKLEEGGLKILREMPRLWELRLRFEVVPREPVVVSSQGFATLQCLTVDSRVPRVTFQEGAMPKLEVLRFWFQFYAVPPHKGPVGINHLRSLRLIYFKCNEDWYGGGDSPCIRPTIDVVRKEARELPVPSRVTLEVCGRVIFSLPPSPPPLEMWQQHWMEQGEANEEERSSGMGEIEEDIQA